MELINVIDKIFKENTDYKTPTQAVNQASSLESLSIDLYTEPTRFIYELLQNADDSVKIGEEVDVYVKISGDNLIVAHSGAEFSERDVRGICNINDGTKKNDINKTGYKGIGFKSVFGQSTNVTIFSNGTYFKFDSEYKFGWTWNEPQIEWERDNDRKFKQPWQIIPILCEEKNISMEIRKFIAYTKANVATIIKLNDIDNITAEVNKLSKKIDMFLFLKNIRNIIFETNIVTKITILRNENGTITLNVNDNEVSQWIFNTIQLQVPDNVKKQLEKESKVPDKLKNAKLTELTIAAKLKNGVLEKISSRDNALYAYLPTNETKFNLPVIVNSNFLTTANRESLHADSIWNNWIFKELPVEIFKWIGVLIKGEFSSSAYNLIPSKMSNHSLLETSFNEGYNYAINQVKFVLAKNGELINASNGLIDETSLAEVEFLPKDSIKQFVFDTTEKDKLVQIELIDTMYISKLKDIGIKIFKWDSLVGYSTSKYFSQNTNQNKEFIEYLYNNRDEIKNQVKSIKFIYDHKNNINYTHKISFLALNDDDWNNPDSELLFVHKEIQDWLNSKVEIREWIESCGVTEKTDITFIEKILIPNIDDYVTQENAIDVFKKLFNLYQNELLDKKLICRMKKIKLLTTQNSLLEAEECYLSDVYNPCLKIQSTITEDIFVNEKYLEGNEDNLNEMKMFFTLLGVREKIDIINKLSKTSIYDFDKNDYCKEYFSYVYSNAYYSFSASAYKNVVGLKYIIYTTNNYSFAKVFWEYCIKNINVCDIKRDATAYWGYDYKDGQNVGNSYINYIPWFIEEHNCLPTSLGDCRNKDNIFLLSDDFSKIVKKYVPVFEIEDLNQEWKSFFNFKTSLELNDYLDILTAIANDSGEVEENINSMQFILKIMLEKSINWSHVNINSVNEWSASGKLFNTNNELNTCTNLNYYLDGNSNIFQDAYPFLYLNAENREHQNLEKFLSYFQIKIIKQNEFTLNALEKEACSVLKNQINSILPYLKNWIIFEDANEESKYIDFENKFINISIYQSKELSIQYKDFDFSKNINVYFEKNELYVTKPWNSNLVRLKLFETLCRELGFVGHEKKLDFLLNSTKNEINSFFSQENIPLPNNGSEHDLTDDLDPEIYYGNLTMNNPIPNNSTSDYTISDYTASDYTTGWDKYEHIKKLLPRARKNIINYIKTKQEYNCDNLYYYSESIVGGIKKNGNDVFIVTRPSDDNKVIIYYDLEFNVLKYVDSELWYEDGINLPRQLRLGDLLKSDTKKMISLNNNIFNILDFENNENLETNPVPYIPVKIAETVAAFANKTGGKLIFGISDSGESIGISRELNIDLVVDMAMSMLNPIPDVNLNWNKLNDNDIYIIEVIESDERVLLNEKEFIRNGANNELVIDDSQQVIINQAKYDRTIAIIVAIEDYNKTTKIGSVDYARNDASEFKRTLIEKMHVEPEDIYTFIDDGAIKSNLEYNMKGLFNCLNETDRLIFYYAGHGFHNGVTNYLTTHDTQKGYISTTAVSLKDILYEPLLKSKCKNALIFIDACAQLFKDDNGRGIINNIDYEDIKLTIHDYPYYATFLSCQTGESSYPCDDLEHGIWTWHLIKALNDGIGDEENITDLKLQEYLANEVTKYVKDKKHMVQTPKAILDSTYENLILKINN